MATDLELAAMAAYGAFALSSADRGYDWPDWQHMPPESHADWRAVADAVRMTSEQATPATLLPAESMTLSVARAQVKRGENPEINTTTMLVMALDRLTGREDWTQAGDGGSGGG
jgi:hypothetical protein